MPSTETLARTLARRTLELVRIPSVSGGEEAIAGHVHDFLDAHTAPASLRRRGASVVARYGDGAPTLVLAGHLDTVPENGHPAPSLDGERVHGLGSTDMKGALAVMMTLAERRAAPSGGRGGSGPPSWSLVFYDNEEVAFERNGLRPLFAAEPWLAAAGLALLLEPTDNAVELGCLGTLHARVTFRGRAAHSARPWAGENAVHKAAPFLARIAALPVREVTEGPATFREVVSVTMAEGGKARNVIPDRFDLNVNFRFAPDRTPSQAEDHVRSLVPEGAEVVITDSAPAASARADAPLLKRFIREGGLDARAKQAWTDAAQFAQHGVPAANFGPGVPELAHRRDESVPVANLVRSYEVLASFLEILARGEEGDTA
jgi:succinyl-diaminopimelate desuccinylase